MSRKTLEFLTNVVLRRVKTSGFDRVYDKIRVVSGGDGTLCCELDVTSDLLNTHQTLHGGVTATLVDAVSSCAFSTVGTGNKGVSVDLNISYLKPAFENDTILIKATTLKCGKNLAVGTVDILNKTTGDLLAQGRHTKYVATNTNQNNI